MNTFEQLQKNNPYIEILSAIHPSLRNFATLHSGLVTEESILFARSNAIIGEAVAYERSVEGLEADLQLMESLSQRIFGGMEIQLGWVYGRNTGLNALEYHKGSEVHIASEDFLALVGKIEDLKFDPLPSFDSAKLSAFYIPAGSVIEFHAWCLHFAPIHAYQSKGFLNLVALPRNSNTPLDFTPVRSHGENQILFARNNWLIVHPDNRGMIEAGAFAGITGINTQINPLN